MSEWDINSAIEKMAEIVVATLVDDEHAIEAFSGAYTATDCKNTFDLYAMKMASVDEYTLELLSEQANADYEDPRYTLYYATLTSIHTRVLNTAQIKLQVFGHTPWKKAEAKETTAMPKPSLRDERPRPPRGKNPFERDYRGAVPHGTSLTPQAYQATPYDVRSFPQDKAGKVVRFRYNGFPSKLVTMRGFIRDITTTGFRLSGVQVDGEAITHNMNVYYSEIVPGTLIWE